MSSSNFWGASLGLIWGWLAGKSVMLALVACFVGPFNSALAQEKISVEEVGSEVLNNGVVASAAAFTCSRNLSRDNSYLDKVQAAYAKVEGLRARFSQESFLSSLSLSEQSAGEVLYKRPGKMRWNYTFPESQTFLVRGQEFWFVQPVDRQVTIDRFEKILLTDAPVSFLLGLGDLTKSFKLISICGTGSGILLKLEERQAKKLKGFSLLVSDATWLPLGAEVIDSTDNKNRILFSQLTTRGDLTDAEFEFTPPSDFDIQDRRILRESASDKLPDDTSEGVEAF